MPAASAMWAILESRVRPPVSMQPNHDHIRGLLAAHVVCIVWRVLTD